MTRMTAVAILICATTAVQAKVTGTGQAGFVMARGNSESDTANARIDLLFDSNPPPLLQETDTLTTFNLVYSRR